MEAQIAFAFKSISTQSQIGFGLILIDECEWPELHLACAHFKKQKEQGNIFFCTEPGSMRAVNSMCRRALPVGYREISRGSFLYNAGWFSDRL
jgi:hypothetical protein